MPHKTIMLKIGQCILGMLALALLTTMVWLFQGFVLLSPVQPVYAQTVRNETQEHFDVASSFADTADIGDTTQSVTTPPPCPPQWQGVSSPNPGPGGPDYLFGVSAISPTDVWAVGYYGAGTRSETLILHWDGAQWTQIPGQNPGTATNLLADVDAISSNDVWAVGYTLGGFGVRQPTLIEHWDGTQWSLVPSPDSGSVRYFLTAVSAVSTNDVWAVGYQITTTGNNQTLTEHWDGTQWSIISSPSIGSGIQLWDVSAIASNDVWAVGETFLNTEQPITEHWNGAQWSIIPSANPPGSQGTILYGVSAVSASDVWAVGDYNAGNGLTRTLIEHWNGVQWSIVPSPNGGLNPNDTNELKDITAISSTDIWAVGYYCCTPDELITLALHWDGTQWSVVPSPNPGTDNHYLFAVSAISTSDVWAVGYDLLCDANRCNNSTLTEHYSITDACLTPSPTPTYTFTPTNTRTPTSTRTPTNTRTHTYTSTSTNTATSTSTSTPTNTTTPTATTTPTITPTFITTLLAHVNWEGRPAQPHTLQQLPITLTLKLGTLETNYPQQLTDQYGHFTLTLEGLPTGTYTWRANDAASEQHPSNYLAKSGTVVLAGEPVIELEVGMMRTGDANNDNVVSTQDFTILKNTFGKGQGDPGYDNRADFNGSTAVNTQDFNLLKGNFGQGGAPPIGPLCSSEVVE